MDNKKKVLVINRGGGDNLGDRLINYSLYHLLLERDVDYHFADLIKGYQEPNFSKNIELSEKTNQPSSSLQKLKKKVPNRIKNKFLFNPKRVDTAVQYDLVIIGGGQLINSNNYFPGAMLNWCKTLKEKKLARKIILLGVGSMHSFKKEEIKTYKKAFEYVDDFYFRDYESIETLKKTFGIEASYIPDVAFTLFDSLNKDESFKNSSRIGGETGHVLVGPTGYKRFLKYGKESNEEENLNYWEDLINRHTQADTVSLFYTTKEDYYVSLSLQNHLNNKGVVVEILDCTNLYDLINYIRQSKMVISPRMHALIIAKNFNIAIEPILISKKIKSFDKLYNQKDFNLKDISYQINQILDCALS